MTTKPDDRGDLRIALRLSFAETDRPDVEFWSKRLRSSGVTVTAARQSGIDAEGPVAAIEKALETKVDFPEGEPPRIGQVGARSDPAVAPPRAYIPRKPTFF